jgi:hypothetical protein
MFAFRIFNRFYNLAPSNHCAVQMLNCLQAELSLIVKNVYLLNTCKQLFCKNQILQVCGQDFSEFYERNPLPSTLRGKPNSNNIIISRRIQSKAVLSIEAGLGMRNLSLYPKLADFGRAAHTRLFRLIQTQKGTLHSPPPTANSPPTISI